MPVQFPGPFPGFPSPIIIFPPANSPGTVIQAPPPPQIIILPPAGGNVGIGGGTVVPIGGIGGIGGGGGGIIGCRDRLLNVKIFLKI